MDDPDTITDPIANETKQAASDASASGRAYATNAVNAAGRKIHHASSPFGQTTEYLTQAINNEPVKAVFITAVVSTLLTAVLLTALRSDRRHH